MSAWWHYGKAKYHIQKSSSTVNANTWVNQTGNQSTMPPGETNSSCDACKQEVENCAIYCLNERALSGNTESNKSCYDCVPQNQMKAFIQINNL